MDFQCMCVIDLRLASAAKSCQPVDSRKKVDNMRKKTWEEEEIVHAEVIGYRID